MKSKPLLSVYILTAFTFLLSCKKESTSNCDIKHYVPVGYLNWLPYFTNTGDTIPNQFFKLEAETYYLMQQELTFYNAALDSQQWKLVYVLDKFNQETYDGCPLYQEIAYTLYNWKIDQHLHLGFVYRDTNYVSSSTNTELYIPMLNIGSCTTTHEDVQGVLGGTCYSTSFDIGNYGRYDKVEYFDEYTTPFSTYSQVFLVKLNHNPNADLEYNIYIAKDTGIVAYENQGVLWALKPS